MPNYDPITIEEYLKKEERFIGDDQENAKFIGMLADVMPLTSRLYAGEWALYVNSFRLGRVSGHEFSFWEKYGCPENPRKEWLATKAVPHMFRVDKLTTLDALRNAYLLFLGETTPYEELEEHKQDQVDGTVEGIFLYRGGA